MVAGTSSGSRDERWRGGGAAAPAEKPFDGGKDLCARARSDEEIDAREEEVKGRKGASVCL